MSDSAEESVTESSQVEKKLSRLGRILLAITTIVIWTVVAVLGIHDIWWLDKGILETPWIITGLILTAVLIGVVIVPLFTSLRSDIQEYKQKKELEEKE
ncbi:MAG: hypothetical protein ACXABK_02995 [Candidatus Heimdallarchaeaceae archaeon]|jgi:membrane protease YdiL (CAAX protease family)